MDPNLTITPDTIYATILAALGVYIVIAIVWYVLQVIANWKIFTKAGEKGWKSIIPVYNTYVAYKIAWKPMFFWITLLLSVVAGSFYGIYQQNPNMVMLVIAFVLMLVIAVLTIMYDYRLAKSFGKGGAFTLGLVFFQPIFILILGFDSSEYRKLPD